MNVQLLMTGNELMSGDIIDTNSAFIAQELMQIGIEIKRRVTIADDLQLLVDEINHNSQKADILIINGGLGPTVDDLTAQALAKACQKPLVENQEALEHLHSWCKYKGIKLTPQNKKQAWLPESADIIANKTGSAVGFELIHNNCQIFCTPGVPKELTHMLQEEIIPVITTKLPESLCIDVSRLLIFGIGESNLQKLIDEQLPNWSNEIELGFRAGMPTIELKLTTRSKKATKEKQYWLDQLKGLLGAHIITDKPISLSEHVVQLLQQSNKTLTTAESCTGGLIASAITQVSGASQVFEAGFVTYSNEMKSALIDVNEQTLITHGAVSEQVVREMAVGALNKSHADYVIAVTGIAGPLGGTKEKPVGTVWIAWGAKGNINTHCFNIKNNRLNFQHHVCTLGLDLIRRILLNCQETPNYLK